MTLVAEATTVERQLAELMGTINAASAQVVATLAEVDRAELWQTYDGIRSFEHWVAWQCGVSPRRARELVTMARRRDELPQCAALFDDGQLTEDAMAAIARRAPAASDEAVASLAPVCLHSQLQRLLASLPPLPSPEPPDEPKRRVDFGTDGDQWSARIDLPLDEGKIVEQALRRARSAVFHERHPEVEGDEKPWRSDVTWADALVRLAESSLVGLNGMAKRRPADRFQVLLHFDVSSGQARFPLEGPMPDTIRRYLMCDADARAAIEHDGVLVALSSRLRTVDDRMRAIIEQRDGGCTVPGCTQVQWLHIHHIVHWEDGGPTESSNLCALCPLHHRLHHLGLLGIEGDPGRPGGLVFRDRHGRAIEAVRPVTPGRPPDPPPKPYVHPSGERLDAHWLRWPDLN